MPTWASPLPKEVIIMKPHTIQLSGAIYQLLTKQAARENRTLEQVTEHLLARSLALSFESEEMPQVLSTSEESAEALKRLTTLFADVTINGLEEVLDDPMLELANASLR
jgi:predicted xylose isomerase-like sugar epimerase